MLIIGEQVLFSLFIIYNLILAKIQRKNAKFKIYTPKVQKLPQHLQLTKLYDIQKKSKSNMDI